MASITDFEPTGSGPGGGNGSGDGGALAALTIELAKQADATTRSEPIAGRSGHDCLRHYLGWASEAANMISNYLTLGQSHEIIFTRAYWALANMDGGEPFVVTAIQDELRRQRRRLLELSSSAGELQEYWQTPERAPQLILIPDTNVYIHHPRRVDQVNWLEMANWAGSISRYTGHSVRWRTTSASRQARSMSSAYDSSG